LKDFIIGFISFVDCSSNAKFTTFSFLKARLDACFIVPSSSAYLRIHPTEIRTVAVIPNALCFIVITVGSASARSYGFTSFISTFSTRSQALIAQTHALLTTLSFLVEAYSFFGFTTSFAYLPTP
jgi:hypothetical protein